MQLKKRDYIIRLLLRHDSATLLGKLANLPLVMARQMAEPVAVPVYATNSDAVKKASPVKERTLFAGAVLILVAMMSVCTR